MDITLVQVRSFLTVARFNSFTQAAQFLHLSQPALTAQVQQLESSLNLRVFNRDTRHVSLTHAGRDLMPIFERLLIEFEGVVAGARDAAAQRQGIVRFASVPSVVATLLPAAVMRFRKQYPYIQLHLRDENSQGVITKIRNGDVEFGIANASRDLPDLDVTDLWQDDMQVVFPNSHPISDLRKVTLEEVAKYPLILLDRNRSDSRMILDTAFAAAGHLVIPACEVGCSSAAVGLVRAGLGIALLASLAISASNLHSFTELSSRFIHAPHLERRIKLIRKVGCSLSPAAQAFSDLLLESRNVKTRWN
ncbi:MAG TPA: LysR family transcriptional regulator [Terriglobales bacterium]|jgi:DNA-binding transcriptional LysR family regulator